MELHQALVEAAAENDDTLMEKFFEEGALSEDDMRAGIRAGLVTCGMFPVFCVVPVVICVFVVRWSSWVTWFLVPTRCLV